jgi:hypothetical protein
MPQARRSDHNNATEIPTEATGVDVIEALDPATRRKVIDFIARLRRPEEAAAGGAGQADWNQPSEPDVYVQHREQWL